MPESVVCTPRHKPSIILCLLILANLDANVDLCGHLKNTIGTAIVKTKQTIADQEVDDCPTQRFSTEELVVLRSLDLVNGNRYKPIQNEEGFAFLDGVLEEYGARYETAGSLYGGSQVWMLAHLPRHLFAASISLAVLRLLNVRFYISAGDGASSWQRWRPEVALP